VLLRHSLLLATNCLIIDTTHVELLLRESLKHSLSIFSTFEAECLVVSKSSQGDSLKFISLLWASTDRVAGKSIKVSGCYAGGELVYLGPFATNVTLVWSKILEAEDI
jgi:hypothetical protein